MMWCGLPDKNGPVKDFVAQTVLSHDYPYPGGHPTHLLCIYTEISGTLHILRCRRLA